MDVREHARGLCLGFVGEDADSTVVLLYWHQVKALAMRLDIALHAQEAAHGPIYVTPADGHYLGALAGAIGVKTTTQ